tara:strand:- start:1316 stop:2359 length:1044 start_codon:yes stop_codon:yes gene_type:complete
MGYSGQKFLVTGAAGFIGAALVNRLLENGEHVVGIDNINSYYQVELKRARLNQIKINSTKFGGSWSFYENSIHEKIALNKIFDKYQPSVVVNLAAQAGVRNSIDNPSSYIESNLVGFANILEACRNHSISHLIYASSSSVYGGNRNLPFNEDQSVSHPVSLYAATKKSNELMAHSYSHLYSIPSTALRFFTVYGPWGRPDMAPMIFANSIIKKQPIFVFNHGKMRRDFTYIDDVVEAVYRCCYKPATVNTNFDSFKSDMSTSFAPHRIFNIGNNRPVELLYFIELLEDALGIKAIKEFKPMQLGDVVSTAADTSRIQSWISFKPSTSIEEGIKKFAEWYTNYHFRNQ